MLDQFVLPLAELDQPNADPYSIPNFRKLELMVDWLEYEVEDLLWQRTVYGEQMRRRLSELELLTEQLVDRMQAFQVAYQERKLQDEIDDKADAAALNNEQRLTARDCL